MLMMLPALAAALSATPNRSRGMGFTWVQGGLLRPNYMPPPRVAACAVVRLQPILGRGLGDEGLCLPQRAQTVMHVHDHSHGDAADGAHAHGGSPSHAHTHADGSECDGTHGDAQEHSREPTIARANENGRRMDFVLVMDAAAEAMDGEHAGFGHEHGSGHSSVNSHSHSPQDTAAIGEEDCGACGHDHGAEGGGHSHSHSHSQTKPQGGDAVGEQKEQPRATKSASADKAVSGISSGEMVRKMFSSFLAGQGAMVAAG